MPPAALERATSRSRTPASWIAALSAIFLVCALLQSWGMLIADTKLDLAVRPWYFLKEQLTPWNPTHFGHLANQTSGYLFPMGPFFGVLISLGLSPWLVQRLWWWALWTVAAYGFVRVGDALEIGTPRTRVVAAVLYTWAPTTLGLLGATSVGSVGFILAPLVLLPLISGARHGRIWRPAVLSAAGAVLLGGVNAAVVFGGLIPAGLYIVTRSDRAWRRRMALAWSACIVAISLRWIVPLFILRRYGFDFTILTERARSTLATQSALDTLRGTGNWATYLPSNPRTGPTGEIHLRNEFVVVATSFTAMVGLAGVAMRSIRERFFLAMSVAFGAVVCCAGYLGPFGGPGADSIRAALDGPFRALRNVHKFEVPLRLALALGSAHVLTVGWRWALRQRSHRRLGRVAVATVALSTVGAVAGFAVPVATGKLVERSAKFESIPSWWSETADYLALHSPDALAVVVPATSHAAFTWGATVDDPLQFLARSPWTSRGQVILSSEGEMRALDAVEATVRDGIGDPGLVEFLRRLGTRYVVLRNDISGDAPGAPTPQVARAALLRSGLTVEAAFGPTGQARDARTDPSAALLRAVEILRVPGVSSTVEVQPISDAVTATGGPEEALALSRIPELAHRPLLAPGTAPVTLGAVSDANRRRQVNPGVAADNWGPTLTADEPGDATLIELAAAPRSRTVAAFRGATITASSSSGSFVQLPGELPFAAFDGDRATAWTAGTTRDPRGIGEWIEARFDVATPMTTLSVTRLDDSPDRELVSSIRITTDSGSLDADLGTGSTTFTLDGRPSNAVRIQITGTTRPSGGLTPPGLAEISIAGVEPHRYLVTPIAEPGQPTVVSLNRLRRPKAELFGSDEEAAIERLVDAPGRYRWSAEATVNEDVASTFRATGDVRISSSSHFAGRPDVAAVHAFDGDPFSSWVADDEPHPWIDISLSRAIRVTSFTIAKSGGRSRTPTVVTVETTSGGHSPTMQRVPVGVDGTVAIDSVETDRIRLRIEESRTTDGVPTGLETLIVIPEISIPGVPLLDRSSNSAARMETPCGTGPTVTIGATRWETSLSVATLALVSGARVEARPCGEPNAELRGPTRITMASTTSGVSVERLVLAPVGGIERSAKSRPVTIGRWTRGRRELRIGDGPPSVLTIHESFSDGWVATMNGQRLRPVKLEQWQQGFLVNDTNGGVVTLDFAPTNAFRWSILAGLAVCAAFGAAAVVLLARHPRTGAARADASSPVEADPFISLVGLAVAVIVSPLSAIAVGLALLTRDRRRLPILCVAGGVVVVGLATWTADRAGVSPLERFGGFHPVVQVLTAVLIAVAVIGLPNGGHCGGHDGERRAELRY